MPAPAVRADYRGERFERDYPAPLVRAGPRTPLALYALANVLLTERIPSSRESVLRLGLVTLPQILSALVPAVENPSQGIEIVDVHEIRAAKGTSVA